MEAYVKSEFIDMPWTGSFADNILKKVWEHNLATPNRIAFINGANYDDKITFLDFYLYCGSISAFLQRNGFTKGDIVSYMSSNTWEYYAIFLGVSQLGGIINGVSKDNSIEQVDYQLSQCRPKVVFCNSVCLPIIEKSLNNLAIRDTTLVILLQTDKKNPSPVPQGIIDIKTVMDTAPQFTPPKIDAENDLIMFPTTSGTTGKPKTVMLTHKNLNVSIYTSTQFQIKHYYPRLGENYDSKTQYQLFYSPQNHAVGGAFAFYSLVGGFQTVILPEFNLTSLLKTIEKFKIRHMVLFPSTLQAIITSPIIKNYDLSNLKAISCGGTTITSELIKKCVEKTTVKHIIQIYGMSELSMAVFRNTFDSPKEFTGKITANAEAKIVHSVTRKTLKFNEPGELIVRGPMVMKGYWNNPEATAKTLTPDGWLFTGDYALIKPDGYLYVFGRLTDMLDIEGEKVPPDEFENLMLQHPEVQHVAVTGVKNLQGGEELPKAFVVKKNPSLTSTELLQWAQVNMPLNRQLTGGITFIDKLPTTPAGKILRRTLKTT